MTDKHEDFPIDTLRHLEGYVANYRRRLMDHAAKIALDASVTKCYCVTIEDVDQAAAEIK